MGVTISIVLLVVIALIAAVVVRWRLGQSAAGDRRGTEPLSRRTVRRRARARGGLAANLDQPRPRRRDRRHARRLPMPVWHRRKGDLSLIEVNEAYARAVDSTREATIAEQRELGIGVFGEDGRALALRARTVNALQRESHHIVVGGSRRLIEITEAPLPQFRPACRLCPRLHRHRSQGEPSSTRHTDSHAEVLETSRSRSRSTAPTRGSVFSIAPSPRCGGSRTEWLDAQSQHRRIAGTAARAAPPAGIRRFPRLQARASRRCSPRSARRSRN